MHVLSRLWHDEEGVIASTDFILFATIALIGTIAGAVAYRDAVVQEMGDVSLAIGVLNQSYSFSATTIGGITVGGSSFTDNTDNCNTQTDPVGAAPACIDVGRPAATSG